MKETFCKTIFSLFFITKFSSWYILEETIKGSQVDSTLVQCWQYGTLKIHNETDLLIYSSWWLNAKICASRDDIFQERFGHHNFGTRSISSRGKKIPVTSDIRVTQIMTHGQNQTNAFSNKFSLAYSQVCSFMGDVQSLPHRTWYQCVAIWHG